MFIEFIIQGKKRTKKSQWWCSVHNLQECRSLKLSWVSFGRQGESLGSSLFNEFAMSLFVNYLHSFAGWEFQHLHYHTACLGEWLLCAEVTEGASELATY